MKFPPEWKKNINIPHNQFEYMFIYWKAFQPMQPVFGMLIGGFSPSEIHMSSSIGMHIPTIWKNMFYSPPTRHYSHHIPIETTIKSHEKSPLNPIKSQHIVRALFLSRYATRLVAVILGSDGRRGDMKVPWKSHRRILPLYVFHNFHRKTIGKP